MGSSLLVDFTTDLVDDTLIMYNPPLNETIWKDDKQVTPDGFYTKYHGDLYVSKKLMYDGSLDTQYSFNNIDTIRNMTDRRLLPYYNKNGKNGYRLYTIKPENIREYSTMIFSIKSIRGYLFIIFPYGFI
jgi:hypothetical protein